MSDNNEIKEKKEPIVEDLFDDEDAEVIESTPDNPDVPSLFVESKKELVIKPQERIDNPVKTGGKQEKKKKKGTFEKDDPRINRNGRPEGRKNFGTIWKMFIEKVALDNGLTPEGVEAHLVSIGFNQAQRGNVAFWNSILDRVYGRATFPIDHTGEVEVKGAKELAEAVQAILEEDDEPAPKPKKKSKEKKEEPPAPKPEAVQDVLSDENNTTTEKGS